MQREIKLSGGPFDSRLATVHKRDGGRWPESLLIADQPPGAAPRGLRYVRKSNRVFRFDGVAPVPAAEPVVLAREQADGSWRFEDPTGRDTENYADLVVPAGTPDPEAAAHALFAGGRTHIKFIRQATPERSHQ